MPPILSNNRFAVALPNALIHCGWKKNVTFTLGHLVELRALKGSQQDCQQWNPSTPSFHNKDICRWQHAIALRSNIIGWELMRRGSNRRIHKSDGNLFDSHCIGIRRAPGRQALILTCQNSYKKACQVTACCPQLEICKVWIWARHPWSSINWHSCRWVSLWLTSAFSTASLTPMPILALRCWKNKSRLRLYQTFASHLRLPWQMPGPQVGAGIGTLQNRRGRILPERQGRGSARKKTENSTWTVNQKTKRCNHRLEAAAHSL